MINGIIIKKQFVIVSGIVSADIENEAEKHNVWLTLHYKNGEMNRIKFRIVKEREEAMLRIINAMSGNFTTQFGDRIIDTISGEEVDTTKAFATICCSTPEEYQRIQDALDKTVSKEPVTHDDDQANLYCPTCHEPVCSNNSLGYYDIPEYCEECGQKLTNKMADMLL